jgi:hypothetical protein
MYNNMLNFKAMLKLTKTLTFIFLFLFINNLFCQDEYIPTLVDGAQFKIWVGYGMGGEGYFYVNVTCDRKIVNDILYQKVTVENCTGVQEVYIREDTVEHKLYYLDEWDVEYLHIDYDLEVGDTASFYYVDFPPSYTPLTVDSIKHKFIYGAMRKVLFISNQMVDENHMFVEGLGNVRLGIYPLLPDFDCWTFLSGHEIIDCSPTSQQNILLPTELSISPNPFTDQFLIQSQQFPIQQIEITNTSGRLLLRQQVHQQLEYNVQASNLPKGVLILKVETEQGIIVKKMIKI